MRPWDRQEGETDKSYQAFMIYLLLGPKRSIKQAWELLQGSDRDQAHAPTYFHEWSQKHGWSERSTEYDKWTHRASIRYDIEKTREIVNEAREVTLSCIKQMKTIIDNDKERPGLRDLSSALNALTAAVAKLFPQTSEHGIDEQAALLVVIKALEEKNPGVIQAIVRGMGWDTATAAENPAHVQN